MSHEISYLKDGRLVTDGAVWSEDCHPYVTDAEWRQLVRTGEVEAEDGTTYYLGWWEL